ncbi:hypothetical protein ACFS07_11820 [Undibacterium arcticum]
MGETWAKKPGESPERAKQNVLNMPFFTDSSLDCRLNSKKILRLISIALAIKKWPGSCDPGRQPKKAVRPSSALQHELLDHQTDVIQNERGLQ